MHSAIPIGTVGSCVWDVYRSLALYRLMSRVLFFFARILTRRGNLLGQWLHNKGMLLAVKGHKNK